VVEKSECQQPDSSSAPKPSLRKTHQIYLSLGSNIAPEKNLPNAIAMLCRLTNVLDVSNTWETPPYGAKGPNFLNTAALVRTDLSRELFKGLIIRRIEVQLGRKRTGNKNAPRTIDLDIIIADGKLQDPKLWTHAFLAVPLAELVPDFINPETQEQLGQVAQRLATSTPMILRPDVHLWPLKDSPNGC